MIIHPLSIQEATMIGATHRAIVTYVDLQAMAAGNTGSLNLQALAAAQGIALVGARLVTPFTFSDAAIITCAVVVGDGGSANRFLTSMELAAVGANVAVKGGVALNPIFFIEAAADNLIAAFAGAAAKNINTATAGEIHFWIINRGV